MKTSKLKIILAKSSFGSRSRDRWRQTVPLYCPDPPPEIAEITTALPSLVADGTGSCCGGCSSRCVCTIPVLPLAAPTDVKVAAVAAAVAVFLKLTEERISSLAA